MPKWKRTFAGVPRLVLITNNFLDDDDDICDVTDDDHTNRPSPRVFSQVTGTP